MFLLASANLAPDADAARPAIVIGLLAIGAIAVLAMTPIGIARTRRHPHMDAILTLAIFWGIFGVASVIYAVEQRIKWSEDFSSQIATGYVADEDATPPPMPWGPWGLLAAGEGALVFWAAAPVRKR
ncbi:MAG: hypothetical protein ABSG31_08650 [Tepidisphaeraceae bacterium]|jgi:hypothetical protein